MYRDLIDHLAYVYGFICKSRGTVKEDYLWQISNGARAMTEVAPDILGNGKEEQQDRRDLKECDIIMEHIDEMIVYFNTTEII